MVINAELPPTDTPDEDPLIKATTGKSYVADQLYLFEASGNLVYLTKADPAKQMALLEAVAGPLLSGLGSGVERARGDENDLQAVLQVHHHLMALGHFAKGFPIVPDKLIELLPYTVPFKQMAEALLQAIEILKRRRVVRDAVSFANHDSMGLEKRLLIPHCRLDSHSLNSPTLSARQLPSWFHVLCLQW